jgi:hypothetical protein
VNAVDERPWNIGPHAHLPIVSLHRTPSPDGRCPFMTLDIRTPFQPNPRRSLRVKPAGICLRRGSPVCRPAGGRTPRGLIIFRALTPQCQLAPDEDSIAPSDAVSWMRHLYLLRTKQDPDEDQCNSDDGQSTDRQSGTLSTPATAIPSPDPRIGLWVIITKLRGPLQNKPQKGRSSQSTDSRDDQFKPPSMGTIEAVGKGVLDQSAQTLRLRIRQSCARALAIRATFSARVTIVQYKAAGSAPSRRTTMNRPPGEGSSSSPLHPRGECQLHVLSECHEVSQMPE